MKSAFIAQLLGGALLLSGCGSAAIVSDSDSTVEEVVTDQSQSPPDESVLPSPDEPTEPEPRELGYVDIIISDVTNEQICSDMDKAIKDFKTIVSKRSKAIGKKASDPYAAAKFVRGNAWVESDLSTKFEEDFLDLATQSLNAVSDGKAGTVKDVAAYLDAALEACGSSKAHQDVAKAVQDLDSKQARVVRAAEDRPWYPKGYREWDSDLAWRYATNQGGNPCGYSRCTYGRVQVVARSGCSRGVYAEMNFKNASGVVDDWSNDTVPYLGAGDKALLTFRSFTSLGRGTIQLVTLRCR